MSLSNTASLLQQLAAMQGITSNARADALVNASRQEQLDQSRGSLFEQLGQMGTGFLLGAGNAPEGMPWWKAGAAAGLDPDLFYWMLTKGRRAGGSGGGGSGGVQPSNPSGYGTEWQ